MIYIIALSSDSTDSVESPTCSLGLMSDTEDGKCMRSSTESNETGDIYTSGEWGSPLENYSSSLSSSLSLGYHAPLLPPFCVSYSMVPPVDLVDSNNPADMNTDIPVYPSVYHYREDW